MSGAKEVKFSLKVMINKQGTKVLFAEADSDFVDVLLSFLTLPLGTILRILGKHYGDEAPVIRSLNTLYSGVANLDSVHFWTEDIKQTLLNPGSTFKAECAKLKLDINDTPLEYFVCEKHGGIYLIKSVCIDEIVGCLKCGRKMKREVYKKGSHAGGGAFIINLPSFIISDDLQIFPCTTGLVQILSNLGITDTDVAEIRNVTFGYTEMMDLLKGTLISHTPLSDIVLNRGQMDSARTKPELGVLFHQIEKEATSSSKKMILKVIVQKSTNKLLFAEAGEDFINFLFSLLTIPIGGVEYLLGSSTSIKNIHNLYRSIADFIDGNYLTTAKAKLLKPELLNGYMSTNPILPLSAECSSSAFNKGIYVSPIKFRNGPGNYVQGPRMYKVTDDLTVTPFCMASFLSTLSGLKIPLSDVFELELQIGSDEALSILRASITSTSALTDGLMNSSTKKQPKQ